MKINLIYILAFSFLFAISSCSDSYEDATSKHIYGESESPYLRIDQKATVATQIKFSVERLESYTVNLEDYSELFQEKMGMGVDEVLKGLNDGSVVFYNINTTRNHWNKAEKTKGNTGWYYNTAGGVVEESSDKKTASLEIDTANKALIVNPEENVMVGTSISFNVGFAINGPDYDDYVRFSFQVSYTDPTIVMLDITIPSGDYASYGIDINDYTETIALCFNMTVDELFDNLETNGGDIRLYVVNQQTGVWDVTSNYTANAPGYWMNNTGAVCNWGEAGFTLFAELNSADQMLYVGRAPEIPTGSEYIFSIGFRNKEDSSYFFRFIITAIMG